MKHSNINNQLLNNKLRFSLKAIVLIVSGLVINLAFAQYEITKHSINNGGGTSSGGGYVLKASVGQADASQSLTAGNYQLNGGFWHENNDLIYKHGFEQD